MPTVAELSDPYTNFMLNPLPPEAENVCSVCLTFTEGYPRCYTCAHQPIHADAVLPISYSIHFGQLHTALAGYKRGGGAVARKFQLELAAVLWRFLREHEACLANRAGVLTFDVVTTVPSSSRERDATHPLPGILGSTVQLTSARYRRLLRRSDAEVVERVVDLQKYELGEGLHGTAVLLVDDTWTTGANAQSAAGVLKSGGALAVGVVVIGRHIHEEYGANAERLQTIQRPFDWDACAFE